MSKEKKYISLKVVSYAIRDFLYALLNNGVSENDIFITKEDDYLVVRIPIESLSSVKYRNEDIPLSAYVDKKFNEVTNNE